ncbi:MAG: aminoacyl-histidine dipeptidase [Chloroflexota bacterium]
MAKILTGIEPALVWEYFEQITQVPRPSKKEERIAEFMVNWAKEQGFESQRDALGNVVVRKPASHGYENRTPVAIQGHLDMVAEKNSDVEFDFDNDPIQPYIDGDWIKARGTTLGADNGIGIAMGMAAMTAEGVKHPPIELLCTLDEETGLTGAQQLGTDLLQAKIMINLDSEEDGAFTIGCAGGLNTAASYAYKAGEAHPGSKAFKLSVKGLRGGHSGIEIHDGRANAAKVMTRLLWNLTEMFHISLSDFNSGNKHNAIPREAFATITVPEGSAVDFNKYVEEFNKTLQIEYRTKEPNLMISAEAAGNVSRVMDAEFQKRLLMSFYVCPHGVMRMSPDIAGLVQTSTNFAIVETREAEVYVLTSQRSSVESEKMHMGQMVKLAFELGGAVVTSGDGYPAWEPNVASPILNMAKGVFKSQYGHEPKIEAIHAGLECGLIGEKYPGMDMLSFGPNLKDVHSPDEMIQISSTQRIWRLLLGILENIPEAPKA